MIQQLVLLCSVLSLVAISTTTAFSPLYHAPFSSSSTMTTCPVRRTEGFALWMATKRKKKKPSMAERRKRRQKKSLGGPNPYADLPSPKLDFSRDTDDEGNQEPIKVANPEAAAEKAKELLKAQRDSVNMLTMVKEKILDRLTNLEFRTTLETNGYAVVDGFFGNDGDETASILAQLEQEGAKMLEEGGMEVDTANLGKGQYVVPIGGGEKQYAMCPRMVEIVVSSTKNVPEAFGESDDDDDDSDTKPATLALDDSACMASLRTFDRKALKASLVLLRGSDDDSALDAAADETPLSLVVEDPVTDKRRLSLYYYVVPSSWNTGESECGGGLEFEGGTRIPAQQDRLVVLYSDKTKCKAIPWKGSDDSPELTIGSAIELHLIEKRQ